MKIIWEASTCFLGAAEKPQSKWHLVMTLKRSGVKSREEMTPTEMMETMWLSAIAGKALKTVMLAHGSNRAWVNYQENGNWAFLRGKEPFYHLHIYGRGDDDEQHPFGLALYFPYPAPEFYSSYETLSDEVVKELIEEVKKGVEEKDFSMFFS